MVILHPRHCCVGILPACYFCVKDAAHRVRVRGYVLDTEPSALPLAGTQQMPYLAEVSAGVISPSGNTRCPVRRCGSVCNRQCRVYIFTNTRAIRPGCTVQPQTPASRPASIIHTLYSTSYSSLHPTTSSRYLPYAVPFRLSAAPFTSSSPIHLFRNAISSRHAMIFPLRCAVRISPAA